MKTSITIALFLLESLIGGAQPKQDFFAGPTSFEVWGDAGSDFETVTSPENKIGERGTTASFQLVDPSTNQPISSKYRDKASAAVYYSTNRGMLEQFRQRIQGKELQDIVIPIGTRVESIFKIGAARLNTTNNIASFRAIFPHDNHPQFLLTAGKIPRGSRVYFLWVFGAPYRDSATLHIDPDELHPKPVTMFKYFFNTVTDARVKSFTMPRELIVAIAGESNSSGEGAPSAGNMPWVDEPCHRSLESGMFLGVQSFVMAHPELSILYKDYFVGCTGADIFGLTYDVAGGRVAQFTALSDARNRSNLSNAAIDVLLLSIGGNDINFHDIVMLLLLPGPALNASVVRDVFGLQPAELMARLEVHFVDLDAGIKRTRVKKTFLMGYPDLTHSHNQTFCGLPFDLDAAGVILELAEDVLQSAADEVCPGDCFSTPVLDYFSNRARCLGMNVWTLVEQLIDLLLNLDSGDDWADPGAVISDFLVELGSTKGEYQFCYADMLLKLNETIERSCRRYNWGYMEGAAEKTRAHGYCDCSDPYFNTVGKSFIVQNDKDGTAHLNKKAHGLVNRVIVENTLTAYLADPANRLEVSTIDPANNPNLQRRTIDPQLKQKLEKEKAARAATSAKLKVVHKKNKELLITRAKKLRPQLLRLKNHFHQKALGK